MRKQKSQQRIQELESKNTELRSHNVDLANELNDRKHIIESYESGSYKRE